MPASVDGHIRIQLLRCRASACGLPQRRPHMFIAEQQQQAASSPKAQQQQLAFYRHLCNSGIIMDDNFIEMLDEAEAQIR